MKPRDLSVLHIPVAELHVLLNLVKPFIAARDLVPAYQQILFTPDTIRAFNGDSGVIAYTTWKAPHTFTLPADRLVPIVGALFDQKVEKMRFEFSETASGAVGVTLRGGTSVVKFLSADAKDFPLHEPPKLKQRAVLTPDWWASLASVEFSVSTDATKPDLQGVHWDAEHLIGGEGFRISRCASRIAPPKGISALLLPDVLLGRFRGHRASAVEVGRDPATGLLWFFLEAGAIFGPLRNATFPIDGVSEHFAGLRKEFVARKSEATWVTVEKNDGALERCSWFVDPLSPRVHVRVAKERVTITATGDHTLEETLVVTEFAGPGGTFNVNLPKLRDALQRVARFGFLPGNGPLYFFDKTQSLEHILVRYIAE